LNITRMANFLFSFFFFPHKCEIANSLKGRFNLFNFAVWMVKSREFFFFFSRGVYLKWNCVA
jgi:hypothetical protein